VVTGPTNTGSSLAGQRVDLHDLAQEIARDVEVVDGHVAEHAARDREVRRGGRLRVATGHAERADRPDLAALHALVDLAERGIEAAVEAEHHERRPVLDLGPAGVDAGHVEVDRLLAQHLLAGEDRGAEQVRVRRGGRRDEDRVDARVLDGVARLRAPTGSVPAGEVLAAASTGSHTQASSASPFSTIDRACTCPMRRPRTVQLGASTALQQMLADHGPMGPPASGHGSRDVK
jgi:hypothetical protein